MNLRLIVKEHNRIKLIEEFYIHKFSTKQGKAHRKKDLIDKGRVLSYDFSQKGIFRNFLSK
jgi:hypothetical protein